jgi:hypothetical protein
MANQDQSDSVRRPPLKAVAQEPRNPATQQLEADAEVNRQQAERLKATQPPPIDKDAVDAIAEDAEQRAKR